MSFWKKLFGAGGAATPAGPLKSIEHKGFTIHATPYQEGGQFQLCGIVEKEIAGERKSHRFVRADRFPNAEEAADYTLLKGRQLVDERSDALLS